MTGDRVNPEQHVEAIASLLGFHAEKEFTEAVADLDGFMPTRVVVEYVDQISHLHRQEVDRLEQLLAHFESLDVTMSRYRELLELLKSSVEAQASIMPELLGMMADIEAKFKVLDR